MKNQEILNGYINVYTDLKNNTTTIKESRLKTKELDFEMKRYKARLKKTKQWHQIAVTRNELIIESMGDEKICLVPIASLEFYPDLEKFQDFNITHNEVEYCCIMGND